MSARHVVQFSGGITSWAAARRVVDLHGTDDVVLLFADTLIEDLDLYRFLDDAARDLGVPVTRVADGRTPTEVFRDRKFIGNSQIAPCSVHLKQMPCRRWLDANADPNLATLYVGIDWTTKDANRMPGIQAGWAPWRVEAPLLSPPYLDKRGWMLEARRRGIRPPRMYDLGFEHNNCGGRCVRGGQGQWAHLLKVLPSRFAEAEADEVMLQGALSTDATHLRDRAGGSTKPLSLAELRRRVESERPGEDPLFDAYDWGGCGCFLDAAEPATGGVVDPAPARNDLDRVGSLQRALADLQDEGEVVIAEDGCTLPVPTRLRPRMTDGCGPEHTYRGTCEYALGKPEDGRR